jgi:hypothetical protein
MHMLRSLAICIVFALLAVVPAAAFDVITIPPDVNAVNLTGVVDIEPSTDGKIQLSTAAGEDGILSGSESMRNRQLHLAGHRRRRLGLQLHHQLRSERRSFRFIGLDGCLERQR